MVELNVEEQGGDGGYDGAGTLLRRYVHSVGTDTPLVWYEGAGANRRWLWADPQGSVFAVVDQANVRLAANAYDEYGIPDAGNLGRFLQTDPIGYDDQFNLYAYVGNDPVNGRDPSGMCDPDSNPDCISDPATAGEAPDLPTTETPPETDEIVVTGLRDRSEQTREEGVSPNDELPIVVIGQRVRELVLGQDYRINELRCALGGNTYDVTQTVIDGSSYDGATAGGHLHRGNRDPGPGPDDGHSVAARGVVQYMAWGRGRSFGAGKVEYRAGAGFTYQGLGGRQPSARDIRTTLGRMNRGNGRGTSSGGMRCSSR